MPGNCGACSLARSRMLPCCSSAPLELALCAAGDLRATDHEVARRLVQEAQHLAELLLLAAHHHLDSTPLSASTRRSRWWNRQIHDSSDFHSAFAGSANEYVSSW